MRRADLIGFLFKQARVFPRSFSTIQIDSQVLNTLGIFFIIIFFFLWGISNRGVFGWSFSRRVCLYLRQSTFFSSGFFFFAFLQAYGMPTARRF
jgi:hypothetical protein